MEIIKVLESLSDNNIDFVLIGGKALLMYGSNRVTFDTDIAVKFIHIDKLVKMIYNNLNSKIVIGVNQEQYPIFAENLTEALRFVNQNDWGFIKAIINDLEFDFLYDIPIPFMKLYTNAKTKVINNCKIKIASLEDIKLMKEKSIKDRTDQMKQNTDKIDLDFINKLLHEAN
ncbi:MAG TPA: hypothetical protein PLD27_12475 [bacterium]|nr:hypothetical protein [bacterium]